MASRGLGPPIGKQQVGADRVWPAVLFYAVVSAILAGPHLLPLEQISLVNYAPADALIFLWEFWWTKQAILGLHSPYWTELLNHPFGTSLAFHGYPLTYSLLSLPFQLLLPGMTGLLVALKVAMFFSFVLAGFGAYLLALHVTADRRAAIVAGCIFSFMPFHFVNMVNLHIVAIELLPFYVLALLRFAELPSRSRAALLGLWLAIAYYTSLEYALYLVFFSILWLGYRLVTRRPPLTRMHFRQLGVAAASFLLLVSPLASIQVAEMRSQESNAERSIEELVHWSPALLSYVTPSRIHPLYGQAWAFAGEYQDGQKDIKGMRSESSLGWTTLCLALAALVSIRRGERAIWALAAPFFLILALGPFLRLTGQWMTEVPLPYLLLYDWVPPLRAGRDPTRLVPIAMLMLSILAAFGVRDLLRRWDSRRTQQIVMVTIVALVLFEDLTPRSPKYTPEVHPLYASLIRAGGDFAVIDLAREPTNLLHQTVHGKPITGVQSTVPRAASAAHLLPVEVAFRSPGPVLRSASRSAMVSELREALRRDRIRFVVLPTNRLTEARARLARALGARLIREEGLVVCDFLSLFEAG